MFDSPRKERSASLSFEALAARALLFLHLAVSDVFRLIHGLVTGKLLGCSRNLHMMGKASFFATRDLFVLLALPTGSPAQHVRYVYSSHACGIYRILTTYWNWSLSVERETEGEVDSQLDQSLRILLFDSLHKLCHRANIPGGCYGSMCKTSTNTEDCVHRSML